MITNIILLKVI